MSDDKVYTPETIQENPLPSETTVVPLESSQPVNKTTGQTQPATIREHLVPTKRIATELISVALNTRARKILNEFKFSPSGAIQIGDYQEGDYGDIRISPVGIVARDKDGNTTFALDGSEGSAVFAGTIQAGTLIGGAVLVGDGNIQIDGATKRMIFYDADGIPSIVIGQVS